jgi:chitin disaccharide deacetylase
MTAHLIVNGDDFGLSRGVNDGIVEAHVDGVLTSASLMVLAPAAAEAAALARSHPRLSLGLHWHGSGHDAPDVDLDDHRAVRDEFARQLERFRELTGRDPTHVDSHHHDHSEPGVTALFEELVEPLGVPLRGDGTVAYVGGFYGQWEPGVTQLQYVSVGFLQRLLREEVLDGWTELGCHPARLTGDFSSSYLDEREIELRTLTDPRVRETIEELGIELASYRDIARA